MIKAGLSGVVATCAPKYMGRDSSGGTLAPVESSAESPANWALQEFRRLIATDFSPAEAGLLISAAVQGRAEGNFDLVGQLARLDELAALVESPTADGVFASLFGRLGFRGDRERYYSLENSLIDRVIDRRLGIPISLSVVFIEVARRVGVELNGVGLPGHFVVATVGGETFYDAFEPSGPMNRAACTGLISRLAGRPIALPPEAFAPMGPLAVVQRMLNNMKAILVQQTASPLAVGALGSVMALRSALPTIGRSEADEWRRLMAPLN
jgi:regulator of sirC expression with transglutaminase-like and TPR domain